LALARWAELATLFAPAHFIVAENDSTDSTKAILAAWAAAAPAREVLTLDGLAGAIASRTVRLAAIRNRLLETIAARPGLAAVDFLIVMDMDEVSLAISAARLRRCMGFGGWDALFANQLGSYYDVWALRDARRSPDDWVEQIERAPPGWRRRIARLRHLHWRNRPIWPGTAPIPVRSAFGGFGIYRLPMAFAGRYLGFRDGRFICEHVPFNEALHAAGARLFIHPGLINRMPMPLYRLIRAMALR
jgi:hypothetical protein